MRFALVLSWFLASASASVSDFKLPQRQLSNGGGATCIAGDLEVTTTAMNAKLLYESPASQAILTDTINEFLRPGGNFTAQVLSGGPLEIVDSFKIHAKLCWPKHASLESLRSVQLLTHGGSLTNFYWDIAPGYSLIDAAAKAGYATFAYDRLGSGASQRPDPISVVQGSMHVEIMHELTAALRRGEIGGHAFERVIGNSHSLACLLTIGQANRYPQDLNAIVLSGISISSDYVGVTLAGPAYIRASDDPRFKELPGGYILYVGSQAIQLEFFKYPFYEEEVFQEFVKRRNTATLGEFFTAANLATPAKHYTGPVFIMNGEYDFPFCGGNCYYPSDQAALVSPALFPAAAASASHIIPRVGHLIFAHNRESSADAFSRILGFLRDHGLAPNTVTGASDTKKEL